MGGNLAWTLRTADGTQHRMDRWTNAMPTLITNPAFLDGAPDAIQAALADWEMMRADWEANKATGTYEHTMTPAYAPYPYGLQPSEYGLVVTDFVTHTILSLQGYTHLGQCMATRQVYGPSHANVSPARWAQNVALTQAGRIASWEFWIESKEAAQHFDALGATRTPSPYDDLRWKVIVPGSVDIDTLNACCDALRAPKGPNPHQALIDQLRQEMDTMLDEQQRTEAKAVVELYETYHTMGADNPILMGHANVDLAPFTLEEFPETSAGTVALHARLFELGFELTQEEEAVWTARIADMAACEAEEGSA